MKIFAIGMLSVASFSLSAQEVKIVKSDAPLDSVMQPLWIIDGLKTNKTGMSISKMIDPNDIESISVLKGDSAINRYGAQGKNGVVLIYTKKAKLNKSGLPR